MRGVGGAGISSSIMREVGLLARVVLDDELLVELERHLLARRFGEHRARQLRRVAAHPFGDLCRLHRLGGDLEILTAATAVANLDAVADLDPEARDVGRTAVHREVAVADELSGLRAARREAHAIDGVVEAHLEQAQQVLAGHALVLLRLLEVVAELALEDRVALAHLLLLAQLQPVLAHLAAAHGVHARRRAAALEGALARIAAAALQEELEPLATADAADGVVVACHVDSPLRPGAAWAGGSRCAGWGSHR